MTKEQLEEIERQYLGCEGDYVDWTLTLSSQTFNKVIQFAKEQAERVEELEIQLSINTNSMKQLQREKDEWKDTAKSYYMTNQELLEIKG